jgi:biotin-dependent carboxylase-like uncharacterized protein
MTIEVIKPGLSTTVQDLGRPGYYHLGIPLSGAMDRAALRAANLLVGNAEAAAALELTFLGPELRFTTDAMVAVTGADMPPKLDGEVQPGWTCFAVKAGQVLSFGFLRKGARAYLGVAGGIDVPEVLGSRSTYVLGGLGGLEGRALRAGDTLPVGLPARPATPGQSVPEALRPPVGPTRPLRVLPGLYEHRLTGDADTLFFTDTWKVAPEADRIGYRFRGGHPLAFVPREQPFGAGSDPSNIVDSCYPYGSIQVPGGTEPIILHRDAVSGGGYFMLGTIISADMDLIAQMQPNMPAQFVKVDMEHALVARGERARTLETLRQILV